MQQIKTCGVWTPAREIIGVGTRKCSWSFDEKVNGKALFGSAFKGDVTSVGKILINLKDDI